jgi:CBS domain-containing protein
VTSFLRRGAITCRENTSIKEVAQIMVVNRIRYCVVVNGQNEVLGIISARSILKAFGKDLDQIQAKDILLPHTITITPNSTRKEAIDLMTKKKNKRTDQRNAGARRWHQNTRIW